MWRLVVAELGISYGDVMNMSLGDIVKANVALDLTEWYTRNPPENKHG
jgi:hypothetical protein